MQLACPNCGTRDVRVSDPPSWVEQVKTWVGVSQLRCRRCDNRWATSVWANGSWRYARCPRCYRQELTKWTEHRYNSPRWTRFLLRLGATPHRCPACRCNFASFRSRKEEFSWRHEIRTEALVGQTPPVEESKQQMP
jgi:hypothetical protein